MSNFLVAGVGTEVHRGAQTGALSARTGAQTDSPAEKTVLLDIAARYREWPRKPKVSRQKGARLLSINEKRGRPVRVGAPPYPASQAPCGAEARLARTTPYTTTYSPGKSPRQHRGRTRNYGQRSERRESRLGHSAGQPSPFARSCQGPVLATISRQLGVSLDQAS